MDIIKLAWVGTRTENAGPTVAFFRDVLGLRLERDEPDFGKMTLPDGGKVEVFGPGSDMNRHFTTGPVAGFLVDDVQSAAEELRSANMEILSGAESCPGMASPRVLMGLQYREHAALLFKRIPMLAVTLADEVEYAASGSVRFAQRAPRREAA